MASVQLSALTGADNQAKVAQCASNLRKFSLGMQLFATDNANVIPGGGGGGGSWPWDFPAVTDNTFSNYVSRQAMYCPGFPEQNVDQMWNYGVSYQSGPGANTNLATGGNRALGYATALSGTRIFSDDANVSLLTQRITLSGSDPSLGPVGAIYPIVASRRVLLADATLSAAGQTDPTQVAGYQWTLQRNTGITTWQTPFGPWRGSSTPHMAGLLPAGGNVAMLDGHVEWRTFTNMVPRTPGDTVVFWW